MLSEKTNIFRDNYLYRSHFSLTHHPTACNKIYDNTDGEITSPMYSNSNADYPNNVVCTYTIRAQNDKHVSFIYQEFSVMKERGWEVGGEGSQ